MNTMQQAPAAPVAPVKSAPRCAGLMLGTLLCALFQCMLSGMTYMANEDYAVLALIYVLAVAAAFVLIAIGVISPAHRLLCVAGFWMYAGIALLELISYFIQLADMGFEIETVTSVLDLLIALLDLAIPLLMAIWMQLLLGNRKHVKSFVPAIVSGAQMVLFLLALVIGVYEGDGSSMMASALISGMLVLMGFHIFAAVAAALMPLFAGFWMKDQVAELPPVDLYQKMREKFMRPTRNRAPDYGQPMQYGGQPQYGQPAYNQPQARPMGGQPQYGRPAYNQPQANPMGGQPQYGQPAYDQPRANPMGGQPQYGQPAYDQPQTPPAPTYAPPAAPVPAAPAASPLEDLGFDDPQINAARPRSGNGFGQ